MDKINILGINITNLKRVQVLNKIRDYLIGGGQHQIVTPNAEIILEAIGRDEELFYIINVADLQVLDGSGPQMAALVTGYHIERYPGADLLKDILEIARKQNRRVAVFNWRGGLSGVDNIKQALTEKYKNLQVMVFDVERQTALPDEILEQVREFKPDIIFSSLGSPYQEKFIFHNLVKLPSAKIGLGVGGAFDFLTGKIRRAPKIFRIIGLEWLWRLVKQPKRWKRIYNAVIVFPYKFFLWRFILPFRYRKNVACLLYRKNQAGYEILIVERLDDSGHWQLPQGGIDGQDLMEAGKRELSEEINTDKFKPVAAFGKLHQYEFGERMSKFMVQAKKTRGYKGQKQSLFIAEFNGVDADIKINFWEHNGWRWVDAGKLMEEVHPSRQEAAKIFMEKFRQIIKK